MSIQLKSTGDLCVNGVKFLVYGESGAGKTHLIKTLPKPIVFSAEGGLITLSDCDIPFVEIRSMADLQAAYSFIMSSEEGKQFQSIALDSISEIAEVALVHEKKTNKDPRAAYGEVQDKVAQIVRTFRDIPGRHVYFSAKLERTQDDTGRMMYGPGMPGKKLGAMLPYFFDSVLAVRRELVDDQPKHMLMCGSDGFWIAKSRGGLLNNWEEPDLGALISRIEQRGKARTEQTEPSEPAEQTVGD